LDNKGEKTMTAVNVVRFRVKPGNEQAFIDAHSKLRPTFKGFLGGRLVKTGDQTFCMLGEWKSFASLAGARNEMIGILDTIRPMLEDLGGGLGVTDPVSGEVVLKLGATKVAKKRRAAGAVKKTKKGGAKKRSKKR
jgi:Antibiotic biosynthesis monooxygenase